MNLYDLFGLDESYRILPNYDTEKYGARPGLEGPMRARNGKVVYYDTKEGKYYDPDTDFYISNDEWDQMNREHVPYGDIGVNEQDKVTTTKKSERMVNLMKAKYPEAQNDIEAILLHFNSGQKQDRSDINTLYSQNDQEEMEIDQLQKELDKLKARRQTNEDYYETDEQRELARLGRILMDMGAKRDDDIGAAMGAVGMELTKYGTPQGVSSIQKLEKVTGQPESVIMKMMALAQKVQGDVAVGDETASDDDEEEVKEGSYEEYLKNKIGRASDEFDVGTNNWEVKVDGKPWKVFRTKASAIKASSTIQNRYNKQTAIYATRKPVSEGVAEDFDTNFKKRIGYTVKGGAASDMMKKQAAQAQQQNRELDPGAAEKGLGIGVLDIAKARKKAKEKGVRAPGSLRASPNTSDPKRLPEAESQMVRATLPNVLFDGARKLERLAKENDVEYSRQGRTVTLTGEQTNVRRIFFKMAYAPGNHPKMTPVNESWLDTASGTLNLSNADVFPEEMQAFIELAKTHRYPFKLQTGPNGLLVTGKYQHLMTLAHDAMQMPTKYGYAGPSAKVRANQADKPTNEAQDDIKIGDTVETKKMGQMQGVVTGFSTKTGDTRVMFKHKSGKVYATVPENLKVISSKKAESLDDTVVEAKKKPVPTQPDKWSYAKSQAKKKFDVYPSAYANAWAAKKYKELGGGWRMGNPKKK